MTARSSTIIRWAIRLLVAAVCFAGVNAIWIANGKGWDSLNFFVAAFAFGAILFPCWCAAVAIEHFYVRNIRARLVIHPVIVAVLFAVVSAIVMTQFFGDPVGLMWLGAQPYVLLAAVCALLDAAADVLLESTLTPASPAAP